MIFWFFRSMAALLRPLILTPPVGNGYRFAERWRRGNSLTRGGLSLYGFVAPITAFGKASTRSNFCGPLLTRGTSSWRDKRACNPPIMKLQKRFTSLADHKRKLLVFNLTGKGMLFRSTGFPQGHAQCPSGRFLNEQSVGLRSIDKALKADLNFNLLWLATSSFSLSEQKR